MMPTLPPTMLHLLAPFVPLFRPRVWQHALVLVAGALLQLRRWLPERGIVVVAEATRSSSRWQRLAHPITAITRLRPDAAYAPALRKIPAALLERLADGHAA